MLMPTSSYNAVGEPFQQVGAAIVGRKQDNDKIAAAGHEKVFSPSKIVKLNYKAPYEHQQERVHVQKNFKDEEGAVITAPRNFLTSPMKKGKVGKQTVFNPIPYIEDDYNSPQKIAHEQRMYHLSKLQEKPFSQQAKKLNKGTFNKDKDIYDLCENIKERVPVVREVNKVDHERAFRPSQPGKKGVTGTIEKFPEYKENPLKPTVRVRPVEGQEDPPRWKMTTNSYSSPT